MSTYQGPAPVYYTKDQLLVQLELIEAIAIRFLPKLQAIFNTEEWLSQSEPVRPTANDQSALIEGPLDRRVREWISSTGNSLTSPWLAQCPKRTGPMMVILEAAY
jgi:hypothetical protein